MQTPADSSATTRARADRLPRALYVLAACMACASVALAWWSWRSGRQFRDQIQRAARVQAEVLARDFGETFRLESNRTIRLAILDILRGEWTPASADSIAAVAMRTPSLRPVVRQGFFWSTDAPARLHTSGPPPANARAIAGSLAKVAATVAPAPPSYFVIKSDADGREVFVLTEFRWNGPGVVEAVGFIGDALAFATTYMEPVTKRAGELRLGSAAQRLVTWTVLSPGGDTLLRAGPGSVGGPEFTLPFWRERVGPDSASVDRNFLSDLENAPAGRARRPGTDPRTTPMLVSVQVDPRGMAQVLYGTDVAPVMPILVLLALSLTLTGATVVLARRLVHHARERETFATTVAHELRTPLTQILLHAETLQLDRAAVNTRADAARVVVRETRRLIHLVEGALQFVRGRRSAVQLDIRPSNLAAILEDTLDGLAPVCAASLAHVRRQLDPEVNASVDRNALQQIVVNLIENALRFGPPGQTITVRAALVQDRPRIFVEDEGPGIPVGERRHVFEPFVGDMRRGGSGIGLAVVQQLVELHDGRVWIEDGATSGARVVIELPAGTVASRTSVSARGIGA